MKHAGSPFALHSDIHISRRSWLLAGASVVAAACLTGQAAAQAQFPSKPVTLVLSFPPGAIVDTVGRKLAPLLSALWGQPVVCENKPGAGGNLAGGIVAKATPDGHTLFFTVYDSLVIAKAGSVAVGYDPVKDLVPVAQVGFGDTLFIVNASSKFQTFNEFMESAKANPGKLNFASNGIGGSYHLALEQLNAMAGTSIIHVPYKGGGPMMIDLLGGRVDAMLSSNPIAQPQLASGRVRVLAMGSARRSALYPNTPTIAELGYPGYDVSLGLGIFAPKGTPASVVAKLNRDINAAAADPAFRTQLAEQGISVIATTPDEFRTRLAADIETTARQLKQFNIRLE